MKNVSIPFNIVDYNKGGYNVITRGDSTHPSCKVRIFCTDLKDEEPILAAISYENKEETCSYYLDGKFHKYGTSRYDLMLIKQEFDNGDIISNGVNICIFKEYVTPDIMLYHVLSRIGSDGKINSLTLGNYTYKVDSFKLATDEERQLLLDKLALENKQWNMEKKCIEVKLIYELEPFDKVLVRYGDEDYWFASLFSHCDSEGIYMICDGAGYDECVPYNDETKHLLKTNLKAPNKYISW